MVIRHSSLPALEAQEWRAFSAATVRCVACRANSCVLHGGGPIGLFWLNLKGDASRTDPAQKPMDRDFIMLLLLVSATGFALLLLLLRDTRLMMLWLAIHLGTVMALFLKLPYGKLAHGMFRSVALLKFNIEKRTPNRLGLGEK
jgi:citrate/tricarballylate utilization protein